MAFNFLANYIDNFENKRELKRLTKHVEQINALEPSMQKLSDEELQAKTAEFKSRLEKGETLDDIMHEAFAVVREASTRVLGMRHFDVQLMGGVVLHQGRVAEMRTGEGKTLVATLPMYLNALSGKGAHLITVNDYLARRDSEQMGQLYGFLGLTTGLIVHGLSFEERQAAYACDITYGTNNEFGFDYLRDNMVVQREHMVQRELNYALVDEVDSILIDEARTPLIISGPSDAPKELYQEVNRIIPRLKKDVDYEIDEKENNITLTEEGTVKVEKMLGIENLADPENLERAHHVQNGLRAHYIMHKDKDYVVRDGEVVIVDEFTGRLMFGRRYNGGLHQAIEAKEGVDIAKESQTLATITFQNYFRMYKKLAGMTGTAKTEEEEFKGIYFIDVVPIPTNKPILRDDKPDAVFSTQKAKYEAIIDKIVERHATGQPVLVGTVSIATSELISDMLKRKGVPHQVLNAKYHDKEAEIVSMAGQKGAVTIATNMAGRGTDIKLGEGVYELGGLYIIGTERHESRRIDNQLRGRAGRQGDPGTTQFYISMEDDLMRRFGGEQMKKLMDKMGLGEDLLIENKMMSNTIETTQRRVEGIHYEARKNVLKFDEVMNKQREIIYGQRRQVLMDERITESIIAMITDIADGIFEQIAGEQKFPEEWDLDKLQEEMQKTFNLREPLDRAEILRMEREEVAEYLRKVALDRYELRQKELTPAILQDMQKKVLLSNVDHMWMDHLYSLDQLRQGIYLRAYAQVDPVKEYNNEAFLMFGEMIDEIKLKTIETIFNVVVRIQLVERQDILNARHGNEAEESKTVVNKEKTKRNELCPCGSGKKYKHCCGR